MCWAMFLISTLTLSSLSPPCPKKKSKHLFLFSLYILFVLYIHFSYFHHTQTCLFFLPHHVFLYYNSLILCLVSCFLLQAQKVIDFYAENGPAASLVKRVDLNLAQYDAHGH
ncbi:unnamed protein product [Sphacelaria rigidula]